MVWGRPLSFSLLFPSRFFLPPRGHAVFERVRLARRLTVGNHIGSSVSEFDTTQVGLGSVRSRKSEQLHSPAAVLRQPQTTYLLEW